MHGPQNVKNNKNVTVFGKDGCTCILNKQLNKIQRESFFNTASATNSYTACYEFLTTYSAFLTYEPSLMYSCPGISVKLVNIFLAIIAFTA